MNDMRLRLNLSILFLLFGFATLRTTLSWLPICNNGDLGSVSVLTAQSTRGLEAQYLFNNDYTDKSGNNNDGSPNGGMEFGEDRFGSPCGAAAFNGRNAFISVPDSRSLSSPSKEITIAAWFKLNPPSGNVRWMTILCKSSAAQETDNSPHYRLQATQATNHTVSLNTEFTEYTDHDFPIGQWLHYALTYDGKVVTAYLNGQAYFTYAYSGALLSNSAPLEIGRDVPGALEYFSGYMDDVRIYSRALSANDIKKIHQDQSEKTALKPCPGMAPPPPPPPVASTPPPSPAPAPAPAPAPVNQTVVPPPVAAPNVAPVTPPKVEITNPAKSADKVSYDSYTIQAIIYNVTSKQEVTFEIDGQPSTNFAYDPAQKIFTAKVRLNSGKNFFTIKGENPYGRDSDNAMVTFERSIPPRVTITNPSGGYTEFDSPDQAIAASVENVSGRGELTVMMNDKAITNYTFDAASGRLSFRAMLSQGTNELVITAENNNGRDEQSAFLEYTPKVVIPVTPTPDDIPPVAVRNELIVKPGKLRFVIFDNSKKDGDIVSVYFNDILLADKITLQINPKDFLRVDSPVDLTAGNEYLLISRAWNVGSSPPNTMTIEVYDDKGLLKDFKINSELNESGALKIICRN